VLHRLLPSAIRSLLPPLLLAAGLGIASVPDACAGLPFSEENCREIFESELRMIGGKIEHPVKYLIREGERVPVNEIETHHVQGMLGQWGNRVETALYRDANSILFLSDGKEALKVDRLGPVIAKECPKKNRGECGTSGRREPLHSKLGICESRQSRAISDEGQLL